MTEGEQLLAEYAANGSEDAFREIVARYVDLVHSAAFRLVNNDAHLAEDVTQTVFADLARMAGKISRDVMLGGWLHRHTCFVASNVMRGDRRRQLRERQAVEMNANDDQSEANLAAIAPVLDDAINHLPADDRAAILLRFFEQKDFRAVGQALGSNEDAARKRVSRALDKLHSLLSSRGIALSATALATTLSTQAVSAAPPAMAISVAAGALATAAATATATGTSASALTIFMSMTKVKVGIATLVVAALAIPLAMKHQENGKLRSELATLRQQADQVTQLSAENDRLSRELAAAKSASTPVVTASTDREVLKLRGEVGRLQTAASTPKPSALSGVIADPEVRKAIRDQQKMGMTYIYKPLTGKLKLEKEQTEKFVELLADDIMEGVDLVTTVLRDGKSREEIDEVFTAHERALQEKVKQLLGEEGGAQFAEYTGDLISQLTMEQFKTQLKGEKQDKEQKSQMLLEAMREETRVALTAAGLPSDYQAVPIMNFRNIASEPEGDRSLKIIEDVYSKVAVRAASFLTPEELTKFEEFRKQALQNSRMSLSMNRKMMAPGGK